MEEMKILVERLISLLEKYLGSLGSDKEPPVAKNPYTIKGHRLYKDGSPVRFEATSKKGGKVDGPRFIIEHYTANNSLEGTVNTFRTYGVSAHIILDKDGTVVQMVPFDTVGWHAGVSETKSKWGTPIKRLNNYSVGIEMVNYGYDANHVPSSVDTSDWIKATHKNESSSRKWQPYTDEQIQHAEWITEALMNKYNIPVEHVKGHDEISPDRKVDPGPAFPLDEMRNRLKK